MKRSILLIFAIFLFGLSFNCFGASPEVTKEELQKRIPGGVRIDSLNFEQETGLYEIVAQGQVLYLTPNMRFLIIGNVIDLSNLRNVTAERVRALRKIDFSSLPIQDAVKISGGKRAIAVFSDPECSYCRKLHAELKKLKDVAVYVYLFPLGIYPESRKRAEEIWCSKDRAKALDDHFEGRKSQGVKECETPIERNLSLAQKHFINGTPTIIFEDNEVINGYMDAGKIQAILDKKKGG